MDAARAWITTRAAAWSGLPERIADLRRRRNVSVDDALHAVEGYRSLARDLASARRLLPGTRVTAGLQSLYLQLHELIRRKPHGGRAALLDMLRTEIPRTVGQLRQRIAWITALFVLSAAAGWWLISTFPELVSLIASDRMIQSVENGKLWTDGILNVAPSSLLSVRIFSNNIAVSVFAVCAGFFFGIGTFFIIFTNGLSLGAAFAFTHQHGLAGRLFEFIVAHGMVELSVICIAGAIGAALGESLIRPTHPTRRESFQRCMQAMAPLILLCAVLLVGAGLIEGFISPDPTFPLASRVVIGACYWSLMVMALTGRLFGTTRARRQATYGL
jgi:uncharacterized membrane protein SpoIIM required for sporulation